MIKKTKNYSMFKLIKKNREKISQVDVEKIKKSILSKNLLHMRPIIVNEEYEILDGQHRFLAAKALEVEIYYDIRKELSSMDVIALNNSKAWTFGDYLNFYIQEKFSEYINFKKFMDKHNLHIKVAISVLVGTTRECYEKFKNGLFVFSNEFSEDILASCIEIRHMIKKMNGYSPFTDSARFWKACLKIVTHPNFNKEKIIGNIALLSQKIHSKVSMDHYFEMLREIHNYRNQVKIEREYISE